MIGSKLILNLKKMMRDRKRKRNGQREIQKERWPWRHK